MSKWWQCDISSPFSCVLRQATTAIVLGVIALLFVSFSVFVLTVLYRRGLAIRRKRAMRRYMESGQVSRSLGSSWCCYASVKFVLTYSLCAYRALSLWILERKGIKSMLGSWSPQSCVRSSCWVTECLDQSIRYWWLFSSKSFSCTCDSHLTNSESASISYLTGHLDSRGRHSEASGGHKDYSWSHWAADLPRADRCKKTWLKGYFAYQMLTDGRLERFTACYFAESLRIQKS